MNKMRTLVWLTAWLWAASAWADETYVMRVDGMACPYCAYGIEKKLKKLEGVRAIDVDLDAGLVKVEVAEGVRLSDEAMERLFRDAGFTFRGMSERPQ